MLLLFPITAVVRLKYEEYKIKYGESIRKGGLCPQGGGSLVARDTVLVTVTPVNDAPVVASAIADTTVIEDSVFGFRAAAPALICNNCLAEETIVRWDPETMRVQT